MMLLAVLLLHPVLDHDGDLRLVAAGTGEDDITWHVDGVRVGTVGDREPLVVAVAAGAHDVSATSPATGRWTALARPEGTPDGAQYVAAWTATHEAEPAPARSARQVPWLPVGLGVAAALLLVTPGRRGLEAARRRRRA